MRNAAMVLGIIGGIVGMAVGFFGYGFAELWSWLFGVVGEVEAQTGFQADLGQPPADPMVTRAVSLVSPILAIAGGAMAPSRPGPGAALMLISAGGMFYGFGFGVFTMWPIAMCAVGGMLALPAALMGQRRAD
ncbi:MAG: hypothetical protein AAGC57_05910 [Pseudomonadota bacterium]